MPTFDLGLEQVSLSYATKDIFDAVTIGVNEGDRIGIVGRNGDGKSTLLDLLSGNKEPDSGRISRRAACLWEFFSKRTVLTMMIRFGRLPYRAGRIMNGLPCLLPGRLLRHC